MQKFKTFFSLTLLLIAFNSQQSIANERSDQINQILDQTGFNKLLQHIPDFAQGVLKQSSGAIEPEVNSALSAAFNQAFASQAVRAGVLKTINAHYKNTQAQAYLTILNSALAKKMAALESTTTDPKNRDDFASFKHALVSKPATKPRVDLIKRLDEANRATAFTVDMQAAFFKAVFTAIDPVLDADMKMAEGEVDKMVREVRQSLQQDFEAHTQLSYLYAFRNLADTELREYVLLCESEDYRWAVQLLGNAMISALNQAAERAAISMFKANQ